MAVAGGEGFTVLLTERGGLLVLGENEHGQIGRPVSRRRVAGALLGGVGEAAGDAVRKLPGGTQFVAALARIEGALGPPEPILAEEHPFNNEAVVMVATGEYYSMCVTDSGAVFATGDNDRGQLGLGDVIQRSSFTTLGLDVFDGSPVMMVACGIDHTLVLTRTGLVWAFGCGANGENGHPGLQSLSVPTRVAALDGIVMVAAGGMHSTAVGSDGRMWTWGVSGSGVLGHDDTGDGAVALPRALNLQAFGGEAVIFVAAGAQYTMAVTAPGDLWAWGSGDYGQLGLGDREDRRVPTRLTNTWGGSCVRMVSCTSCLHVAGYTMAVTQDGVVWTWGHPYFGQLGHVNRQQELTPTRIPQTAFGGAHVVLVYNTPRNASMAVTMHGLVYQWGDVTTGHLPESLVESRVPIPLGTSVCPEGRCGRGCALPRRDMLVFAQGTHARLGAECVFREIAAELIEGICEQTRAPDGAYAHMHEGQLRLLAATVRVT